ncbi:MAG: sterol desaturase family protein [Haliangiales bacterium]
MDTLSSIEAFEAVFKPILSCFSVLAILTEIGLIFYLKRPWNIKSRAMSGACFVVAAVSGGLFHVTVVYFIHDFMYDYRLFDYGFAWYGWVLCFLLIDMMFYVTHRMHHRLRVLWCVHFVHHSAEEFELPTGIRGSFLDAATQFPVYAWLPLVGIHPLMYLITDTVFKFLIFIYHTELVGKLGFLEKIIVTPSSHRVHHGKNIRYLDRNYGGVFIIFDKLLGTYQEEDERPVYGVRNKPANFNLIKTQGGEFVELWRDMAAAPTLKDKLKYALMPPGWRHDGPGETSDELQRRERAVGGDDSALGGLAPKADAAVG